MISTSPDPQPAVARLIRNRTTTLVMPETSACCRQMRRCSRFLLGLRHNWLLLILLLLWPGTIWADELSQDQPPVQVAAASTDGVTAQVDLSDPTKFPFSSTGKWKGYLDFLGKPGTERSIGQPDLFLPLLQDKNDMTFFNLRGQLQFDNTDVSEYNIGLGHRHMFQEWILGGYGYYDQRHTQFGNSFNQFTGGFEALSVDWAARVNGYLPENKTETMTSGANRQIITPGDQIFVQIDGIVQEKALPGVDGEVGYLLPIPWGDTYELRAYAGGYHFFGENNFQSVTGPRGRVEWRAYDLPVLGPGSRFMMGVEAQWDEARGEQAFGLASLRIPFDVFEDKSKRKGLKGLDRRMLQPVIRDVDVVTSKKNIIERTGALNPAGDKYDRVMYWKDKADMETQMATRKPGERILGVMGGKHWDMTDFVTKGNGVSYVIAGKSTPIGYYSPISGSKRTLGFTPQGTAPTMTWGGDTASLITMSAGDHINGWEMDATGFNNGIWIREIEGDYYITNTSIMNANNYGVRVNGVNRNLFISNSIIDNNGISSEINAPRGGLRAQNGAHVYAKYMDVSNNRGTGVVASDAGSYINITHSTISFNGVHGLSAHGRRNTPTDNAEIFGSHLWIEGNGQAGVNSGSDLQSDSYFRLEDSTLIRNGAGIVVNTGGVVDGYRLLITENNNGVEAYGDDGDLKITTANIFDSKIVFNKRYALFASEWLESRINVDNTLFEGNEWGILTLWTDPNRRGDPIPVDGRVSITNSIFKGFRGSNEEFHIEPNGIFTGFGNKDENGNDISLEPACIENGNRPVWNNNTPHIPC